MTYAFPFPDVGEGITEGHLIKWHVKIGDDVKEDQIIADVETDKAVVEIPAPRAGTVVELKYKEGDTIKVGEVMLVLAEKGEKIKATKPEKQPPSKKDTSVGVVGFLEEATEVIHGKKDLFAEQPSSPKETPQTILALPRVRQLAHDLHVNLNTITGTGKNNEITEEDVRKIVATPAPAPLKIVKKYDLYGYVERIPFTGMRKTIAKNMVASSTGTASVTHMDEADITHLWDIRQKEKEKALQQGIKLTFLPFIIKAVIAGLKKHPALNASLNTLEDGNQEIILKKYYNLGIGVDTPDGLMVFVIKGADDKNMLVIAKEIDALATKARNRTIDLSDLKGGTFTLTNYGSIGGIHGTPIINPGEAAILGIGKIIEQPRVIDGKIIARKILPLSLTFDHRITDGAEAARFVNVVIEHLEDPDLLLIED